MNDSSLKHFDIMSAKRAYAQGQNVTQLLRAQKGVEANTPDIIEVAYDLQAGTYVKLVEEHLDGATRYTSEIAAILDEYLVENSSLLDIGTGELTTLSLLVPTLRTKLSRILAFDISWSRVYTGLSFARARMGRQFASLVPFVADITEIPLRDKSVDVTTSSHALEPNGGTLPSLMRELFRVTRERLVLFEPCYEISSAEGRQRMDRLGYIKDVEGVAASLGGTVLARIGIRNVSNPLNPTACFVIAPPTPTPASAIDGTPFAVPGTDYGLSKTDDFYWSKETGLCFPVLKGLPVLKSKVAILASALE